MKFFVVSGTYCNVLTVFEFSMVKSLSHSYDLLKLATVHSNLYVYQTWRNMLHILVIMVINYTGRNGNPTFF
jgi:hypothetical protein